MAHEQSTTRKRRAPHTQLIPAEGKHTRYDFETGDHAAYLDGQLIGYYNTALEAGEAADAAMYRKLQREVQA